MNSFQSEKSQNEELETENSKRSKYAIKDRQFHVISYENCKLC